eukprot:1696538-Rhodomonas_salina.2
MVLPYATSVPSTRVGRPLLTLAQYHALHTAQCRRTLYGGCRNQVHSRYKVYGARGPWPLISHLGTRDSPRGSVQRPPLCFALPRSTAPGSPIPAVSTALGVGAA